MGLLEALLKAACYRIATTEVEAAPGSGGPKLTQSGRPFLRQRMQNYKYKIILKSSNWLKHEQIEEYPHNEILFGNKTE